MFGVPFGFHEPGRQYLSCFLPGSYFQPRNPWVSYCAGATEAGEDDGELLQDLAARSKSPSRADGEVGCGKGREVSPEFLLISVELKG